MLHQEAYCVAYFVVCILSFVIYFPFIFVILERYGGIRLFPVIFWLSSALRSWLRTNYAIFTNICNNTFSVTYNIACNRTMCLTQIMYDLILCYCSNSSNYLILRTFGSRGPLCMLSFDKYQYAVCSLCWICMKMISWTYANPWPNTESTREEQEQIDAQELTRQIRWSVT